jgi:hypothetical protein
MGVFVRVHPLGWFEQRRSMRIFCAGLLDPKLKFYPLVLVSRYHSDENQLVDSFNKFSSSSKKTNNNYTDD